MISDEAVKAAAAKLRSWTDDEEDEFLIDMAADVLQAALPVLLEGKAEEIARQVDPHAWASYDDIVREGWSKVDPDAVREKWVGESIRRANRIISILTGES